MEKTEMDFPVKFQKMAAKGKGPEGGQDDPKATKSLTWLSLFEGTAKITMPRIWQCFAPWAGIGDRGEPAQCDRVLKSALP